MNNETSNYGSKTTITKVVEKTVETTNSIGITDKHPSNQKLNDFTNILNLPFRKCIHAFEYLVLSILLIIALSSSGVKGNKIYIISIIICFIYACTDEYHQLFIDGRTGQFMDVLIDISGGLIGIVIIKLLEIIKNKLKRVGCNEN